MPNPIRMLQDWSQVRKLKAGLLDGLRQTPPGAGVTIKDPGNPITARALIELLREYPEQLECTDFGFEVTLMRKLDMRKTLSASFHDEQLASGGVLDAKNVTAFGLGAGAKLPAHEFRFGVDAARINGTEAEVEAAMNLNPRDLEEYRRKRAADRAAAAVLGPDGKPVAISSWTKES